MKLIIEWLASLHENSMIFTEFVTIFFGIPLINTFFLLYITLKWLQYYSWQFNTSMNQKFVFFIVIDDFNLLQFGVQKFLWQPTMHPGWNQLEIKIAKISATSEVWNGNTWQPNTQHSNQCIPMKGNIMNGKLFISITV